MTGPDITSSATSPCALRYSSGKLLVILEQLLGQKRHTAALAIRLLAQDQVALADDADDGAVLDDRDATDSVVDQQADDVADGRTRLNGDERGAHDSPSAHPEATLTCQRT